MIRIRFSRCAGLVGIVAAFVVAVSSVTQAGALYSSLYGVAEWHGYFTNKTSGGKAWAACGPGKADDGRLFCNGNGSNNINEFVNFYRNALNSGSTQDQRSGAFTVLVMLGIDHAGSGGTANGVQNARNQFPNWERIVRAYDAAGKVNYHYNNFWYETNTSYRADGIDDIQWHNQSDSAESIVFTLPNGSHVAIKRACGNMVGPGSKLEEPSWSLSASSTVRVNSGPNTASDKTASPNDTIFWSHTLQNDGPGNTMTGVHSNLELTSSTGAWGNAATEYEAGDTGAGAGVGTMRTISGTYSQHTVTQDDVGNTLCEAVRFAPANSSGTPNGRGNTVCVAVPYNYTLTPSINSTLPSTASAGTKIDYISGTIANAGPTRSKNDTIWQLTRLYVAPDAAIPGAGGAPSPTAPCTAPAGGDARFNGNFFSVAGQSQCQALVRSGGSVPTSGTGVSASDFVIDDALPVGTRVCFALSVRDRSSSDTRWQHSDPRCLTIAKRPKVHVNGGDLVVGRGYTETGAAAQGSIYTSTTTYATNSKTYGSWSEYGVAASGLVRGMSSAAGFSNGATTANLCSSLSLLTLTNTPALGSPCSTDALGRYSIASPQPSDALKTRFGTGGVLGGSVDVASGASGVYTSTTNPLVVGASRDVPAGHWIVINAPNVDVRITQNIQYTTGALSDVKDIPQVVIIGRNVSIADSVTHIDAWIVATGTGSSGTVNTCDAIGAGRAPADADNLTSKKCDKQLVVNGPVVAKHLYLYRTAGADSAAAGDQPAEVFNLRPDAYMWLANQQRQTVRARTVVTSELPPRY